MQYSFVIAALVGAVVATPVADGCVAACNDAYSTCRIQPNSNQAQCAALYSSCLGYLPFASNGTLITPTACSITTGAATTAAAPTAASANNGSHVVYTTKVVTELTTFCPAPTVLTYNDKTYTVSSATTLTITNCPCTITTPVAPAAPSATGAVYTTKVVTELTTFCPAATTLTIGGSTIPVAGPTTLTVSFPAGVTITSALHQTTPASVAVTSAPHQTTPAAAATTAKTSASVVVAGNATTTRASSTFTGAAGMMQPAMALLALGGAVVLL